MVQNLFLQAASKWKIIGTLLMIPPGTLEAIEHDNRGVIEALLAVFTSWRRSKCTPYSWKIVLKVLATDIVGHRRLADDIAYRLSGEKEDCVFGTSYIIHESVRCPLSCVLWLTRH